MSTPRPPGVMAMAPVGPLPTPCGCRTTSLSCPCSCPCRRIVLKGRARRSGCFLFGKREALGWRSRRLRGRIPLFAAGRRGLAFRPAPFAAAFFVKAKIASLACWRDPCAHELRTKRHRNSSEGRGRIRNEGGERRGARLPRAAGNRALLRNPASKRGDLVFLFCRRRRFRLSLRTVAPADDLLRVLKRHPVPRRLARHQGTSRRLPNLPAVP